MKQFESWWNKNYDWCLDFDDCVSEVIAEEAWEAALEWVLYLDTAPENILQSDGTTAYDVREKWSIAKGKIMRELGISPFYSEIVKKDE